MKTTPEALKALYQTLGGSSGNVAGESKTTGILNKIAALFGSTASADKIPDAIDNLNAVASGITKPSGKKSITTTAETDVADYATAQISDANLVAGNIKKDVAILGVTGSYEGGGGSSDFSTAEVTLIINAGSGAGGLISTLNDSNEGYAFVVEDEEGTYLIKSFGAAAGQTTTGKALLMKESDGTLSAYYTVAGSNPVITGDAAIVDEQDIKITGDCTITVDPTT